MKQKFIHLDKGIVLGSVFLILSSLLALLIPLALKGMIDQQDSTFNTGSLLVVVGLFIGQALLVSLGNYFFAVSGERQVASLRQKVSQHLMYAPKSFFDTRKSGELSSRIVNDTATIREFVVTSLPFFLASIITLIGTTAVLFYLDWKLSLVLLLALPLMALFIIPLSSMGEKYAKILQDETSQLTGELTEQFQEIELIKTQGAEEYTSQLLGRQIETMRKISIKSDLVAAFNSPFALLFIFGTVALIFTYGGQRVAAGSLTVGTLVSFLIYLFQLLNPVGGLSDFFTAKAKVAGATAELVQLLDIAPEQLDEGLLPGSGDLVFENVSFSYQADKPVLDGVDLVFPQRKKIALVGPSGAGKSTIFHLIERFYPLSSGQILLGGQDIATFSLGSWRQKLALVSQNAAVFSGSIRDNLCYALDREVSDEELHTALDKAALLKDIQQMPEGLETAVGERGKLLSGGQKQRLQIARAYLRQADFILFDEATANLDADAEYAVTQSLNAIAEDKTVIIIAHRLSTVVDADIIYVIDQHKVTGVGSHTELLTNHQTYARFVAEQML
ncbi:TPA: ABC transporter ATP-binding protein [Streptococcus suis]|nr:ABC transporter ATP-binding protein [Streptococcus suis]